jgi:hypothetical protein
MSVVYGIVMSLGGAIRVRSEAAGADVGTDIRVYMPTPKLDLVAEAVGGDG